MGRDDERRRDHKRSGRGEERRRRGGKKSRKMSLGETNRGGMGCVRHVGGMWEVWGVKCV